MNRIIVSLSLAAALLVLGCHSHEPQSAGVVPAAEQDSRPAVDLHNTVCPVSGDKVGNSKLTGTYDGKIYHLCCDDCPKDFKKDPKKYADAVAADPAKYGVN